MPNPLPIIKTASNFDSFFVLLTNVFARACFYAITTDASASFNYIYSLSDIQVSLVFIPIGIGGPRNRQNTRLELPPLLPPPPDPQPRLIKSSSLSCFHTLSTKPTFRTTDFLAKYVYTIKKQEKYSCSKRKERKSKAEEIY